MRNDPASRVRLGEFELDVRTGELSPTGSENERPKILLRQQPFDVLRLMIEAEGEIVTRQEIKKRLWPNDTIVNFDHSINVAIGILRRAMGDSADVPQYIETVARRGYRLRVPIEWLETEAGTVLSTPPIPPSPLGPAGLIGVNVSHYRVVDFLGAGGMGMVYKAEDLKLARRVALKFLPDELTNDAVTRKRFEREAQTASALNHPNICTIYEIDEQDGQPFIAMELLDGDSLQVRLANYETKRFPPASLLDISIQVCDGLQAAHNEGIIHRDIKPGNLFLTRQGKVKILDFGLAKAIRSEDSSAEHLIPSCSSTLPAPTESAMGTTGYMSPEQLRNEPLDARTDLFSLGIVLYEMTTGGLPFRNETQSALKDAVENQSPAPPQMPNAGVSRELSAVIEKATHENRNLRYQSASEMRSALERVRQQRVPRSRSGGRLLTGVLAASLVLAITLFASLRSRLALTPGETIVVGIENNTRDPALNDALYIPLTFAMEETPYFTALPLTRAAPAFSALHLSGDPMRLSPRTARQVCVQTSSKLAIAAFIREAGNGFGIELQAIECQSGRTIAKASKEAPSRSQIVHTLGVVTAALRADLGESATSIATSNKPLEQASSASPEALEMLLEGYKRNLLADYRGAASNYQEALNLDPDLAAALASLAAAQDFLGDEKSAVASVTRAYALRERLTNPVRLHAESLYYDIATGDREKECAVLSESLRRFPNDFISMTNLKVCLLKIGQLDRALAETHDAVRLYPSPFSYDEEIFVDLVSDHFGEAEVAFAQTDALKFDSPNLRYDRGRLAFLLHDEAKMQEQWKWAEGKPVADFRAFYQRAETEAYLGHYRSFRRLIARARELAIAENEPLKGAEFSGKAALTEAEAGNFARALQLSEEGLRGPQYRGTRALLTLSLARAGKTGRAQEFADSLNHDYPLRTEIQEFALPTIQAAIKIRDDDPAEGIRILERTRKYDFTYMEDLSDLYPAYVRGLAWLQLHEGPRAQTEFRKLIDHPGAVEANVIGALSRLQLARALSLSGDTAAALKSYRDFLNIWKTADVEIPIYQQAKGEYSALTSRHLVRKAGAAPAN
jgi:serine/threonine protein kinase/Tfp pilus assembly protein PilF